MGILAAGQQAALGKFLAFTRAQEGVADASGARYLAAAGISGKGSIAFFKTLQNFEFRLGIPQEDSYARTHPLSGERISVLEDTYRANAAWTAPLNAKWEADFKRVKAKLSGYLADPNITLRDYPESDVSIAARYARAYAWHKAAYPEKALAEASTLLKTSTDDPYFLELYGQILLESGQPANAIEPLRKAVKLTGNQPLIAAVFGHAQQGDRPRAALASAERYLMEGAPQFALPNAQEAMAGLPEYSPDWIRAQDINLVAEARLVALKKKRR